jgi:hypothetical protein
MLVGNFAIFHGYAHGAELPAAIRPVEYSFGFVTGISTSPELSSGLLSADLGRAVSPAALVPQMVCSGPTNTRVSAVLSTERLSPWSLGQRRARLILNPWAQRHIPRIQLRLDTLYVERDRLRCHVGSTFREIFALAEGWPE